MAVTLYRMSGNNVHQEEFDRVTEQFAFKGNRREKLTSYGWFFTQEQAVNARRERFQSYIAEAKKSLSLYTERLQVLNAMYPHAQESKKDPF